MHVGEGPCCASFPSPRFHVDSGKADSMPQVMDGEIYVFSGSIQCESSWQFAVHMFAN